MSTYNTVIELLDQQLKADAQIRFIAGANNESLLSFAELGSRALQFLGSLQNRGMRADDELIILTNSNEQFLIAFWGAILGGIIPVPIAVGISDEQRMKLFRVASQLRNPTLFTDDALQTRLQTFVAENDVDDGNSLLEDHCMTSAANDTSEEGVVESRGPDDLAFIQYSSGSTSDPKGVCLTHRNLASTLQSMSRGLGLTADDSAMSWMPLTHDMGLIGYHLTFFSVGLDHTIMDTSVFVRRPLLWLSRASELKATVLCSPNFGYKHYLKMFERKPVSDMDLSAVRLLLNGAEPISVPLCEEFLDAMAPFGLKRSAMFPVYGLAEATLAVTFPEPGGEYEQILVKRHSLRIGEPYEATDPDNDDAVSFVKLGTAIDNCEYRITDDDDVVVPDGYVGNIQISGDNITEGLYRDPDRSKEMFSGDGWLRTGDCGVRVDRQLVVTGRAKDIIIVNGQNYYPHDIEEIIANLDELELGKVVVSGAKPAGSQVEELLVFILHRADLSSFQELAAQIRDVVGAQAGLEVDHVIPVKRIPKTTSGKIQRAKLGEDYLDGEFNLALEELLALAPSAEDAEAGAGGDPMVAELLGICAEFSRDRKIGADDNLFEVGISSLTLTEIMLAVEEKYPGKVEMNDLFDHPTIGELAVFLTTDSDT
jgi:acyl-CoA synthetase (AMP-forming)/AMP-acid ligase II/acyl carrier protein